jgi:hypothetical protein
MRDFTTCNIDQQYHFPTNFSFQLKELQLRKMAGNPCYSLLWLILLVFIAWPVAGLCAGLWIFCMVSKEQIDPNQFLFLLQGISLSFSLSQQCRTLNCCFHLSQDVNTGEQVA